MKAKGERLKAKSTELVRVAASPVPRAWRVRFAEWRKAERPACAIQLIMEAARRGKLCGKWGVAEVEAALECLHEGLPRVATRRRRLRGLLARVKPRAVPVKAVRVYYITGEAVCWLRIGSVWSGQRRDGARFTADTRAECEAVLSHALAHWGRLTFRREVEDAAEELKNLAAVEARAAIPAGEALAGAPGGHAAVPQKSAGLVIPDQAYPESGSGAATPQAGTFNPNETSEP